MADGKIFTQKIEEMNPMGNGITKCDGCVVFCLGAVDGDTVRAEITEEKKNYKIARVCETVTPSPYRRTPDCDAYSTCGGCSLRHIDYEHEKEIKLQSISQALRRGGLGSITPSGLLSGHSDRYRNKAVFRFMDGKFGYTEEKGSGFIPVEDCRLCPEIFSEIAAFCAQALRDDPPSYLFLRCSKGADSITAVIGTGDADDSAYIDIIPELCRRFPQITGVFSKQGAHPEDRNKAAVLWGKEYLETDFLNMKLKISPDSFFQINYDAAEMLCKKVGEYACEKPNAFGADLYCGTGIIGLSVAALHPDAHITGVEINSAAVSDAKDNAAANALSNIGFFCGDSADFASNIYGSLDFVTIDPPRAGCSDKMIKELLRIAPRRIVYVSCEPSSLARDLRKLCEKKYRIQDVTACDLFPRTRHVESICLLDRV